MPSEDVWLSGVFGGKSVSLECITGESGRSRADFGHFQASFEDLLLHVILDVSHVQRIRDFLAMRYINVRFTYLLTYLLTWGKGKCHVLLGHDTRPRYYYVDKAFHYIRGVPWPSKMCQNASKVLSVGAHDATSDSVVSG